MKLTDMQQLLFLSQALSVAVDRFFLKREHAGAVFKKALSDMGLDSPKESKEVSDNGMAKKD